MSANGWEPTTENQRMAVSAAIALQRDLVKQEKALGVAVRFAREKDVPILYLADALGVSRSRIRVLARPSGGAKA